MRRRAAFHLAAAVLCIACAGAALPDPAPAAAATAAKEPAPAGGVYVVKAERRDGRACFRHERRRRAERYVFGGCTADVALHGRAAYNCHTRELAAAGFVDPRAVRVLIVLTDGRRVPARLFSVPEHARIAGQLFARVLRIRADAVDEMHPALIRAYDASGSVIATQEFPSGSALGFGCF